MADNRVVQSDTNNEGKKTKDGSMAMDLFQSTAFQSRVQSLMSEWHVPGMSMTLIQGQNLSSKAFGYAVMGSEKVPCTPDTLFDLASVSKSTTATAMSILVDDEEQYAHIKWTTPVHDVTEDFIMNDDSYTKGVTIEDILSHRSGLPTHDNSYFGINSSHPDTPATITRNLRNLPISQPIRQKEQYNNLMYTVSTHVIETIVGKTFGEFIRERIWKPLNMTSTNLQPNAAREAGLGDRMSKPFLWDEDKKDYITLEYEQTPEAQGAGSIWTSSKDYALFVKAIMNQEAPITEGVYQSLIKPRIFSNPDDDWDDLEPYTSFQAYCLGLETYFYRGHKVVQHDGLISGFSSVHFFIPEYKVGGVFLGNSENAGTIGSGILLKEILDELFQTPESERPDWNAIQHKNEDEYNEKQKEEKENLRKELSTNGDGVAEPQKLPLDLYVGEYWNVGYKGMKVQIKNDHLFIDASDRTMAFTLDFEHISSQTNYIATLYDVLADNQEGEKFKAVFAMEGNAPKRMGLKIESDLDDLIWFDRVENGTQRMAMR